MRHGLLRPGLLRPGLLHPGLLHPGLLHDATDDLLAALLPVACVGCQCLGAPVCARCATTARRAPDAPAPPGVDRWVAAYAYEGVVREAIARAKYRDQRAVLSWLVDALATVRDPGEIDVVTWVPASRDRLRARGVDHARLLARGYARRCDLPVRRLLRRRDDVPQTGRAIAARRRGPDLVTVERRSVTARRVLVVDDVATTGATAAVAAAALRGAGASSVAFATVARTPRHG